MACALTPGGQVLSAPCCEWKGLASWIWYLSKTRPREGSITQLPRLGNCDLDSLHRCRRRQGGASTDVLILSGGSRELTALLAWASGNVWRSHKSSDLFFFCQVHFDFPVCSHPPLPDFTDLFPPLTQDYTYLLPGIVTQNTLCLFNQHSWFSSGKDGGQGEGLGEGEVNYEPWTALVTSFLSRPLGKSDASCRNRGI